MATYDDFLSEIQGRAYGVSEPQVEQYVRIAAIEFCETTRLWTRQVQEYAFKGDGRVDITGFDEDQEDFEALVMGPYNGIQVVPIPPMMSGSELNSYAAANFEGMQQGHPAYVFELPEETSTVGVWPIPDKQYADLTFKIILKPSTTATILPDFLQKNWRRAIIEGALMHIHGLMGMSYTDPRREATAMKKFENAKLAGRIAANRGRAVDGNLTVQMRPFSFGSQRRG